MTRTITVLLCVTCFLLTGATKVDAQTYFPDRITGIWQGYLQLWSNGSKKDSVQVILTVAPKKDQTWQWKMEYLSEKTPMTKDYIMRLKDKDKNIFITDEGGGVELEDYVFGNKLFSLFETQDFWLTSTQELKDGKLIFEVTAGKASRKLEKEVTNYAVTSMQRAVLTRKR